MNNKLSQHKFILLAFLVTFTLSACGGGGVGRGGGSIPDPSGEWLIPTQFVADGGPGKDGIPALENPSYELASSNTTLGPGDMVIALRSEGQVKVFPHDIMDWHEIGSRAPPWHGKADQQILTPRSVCPVCSTTRIFFSMTGRPILCGRKCCNSR